jgi:hypothetical protein
VRLHLTASVCRLLRRYLTLTPASLRALVSV